MAHKHWSRRLRPGRLTGAVGAVYSGFAWAVTLLFVMLLWVPFRAQSFSLAGDYMTGLFTAQDGVAWLKPQVLVLAAVMAGWHVLVAAKARILQVVPAAKPFELRPLFVLGLMVLAIVMFAPLEASPFIYFQF